MNMQQVNISNQDSIEILSEFEAMICSWFIDWATHNEWIIHKKILLKYFTEFEAKIWSWSMVDEHIKND
jgi:hypothetical protein